MEKDSTSKKKKRNSQEKRWHCIPMQNGRNRASLTAVIYRCLQSGERPHAEISGQFFRRKRRSPRSRSRCRNSTIFQEHCGNLHISKSCCSEIKVFCSKGRFCHTFRITLKPRDKRKRAFTYFMRLPSMIVGIVIETSHFQPFGLVWQDSNCSTKIHQKDTCEFKEDFPRNRSQQDLNAFAQTNGQTCRTTLLRKAIRKWAEEEPKLEAARERRWIFNGKSCSLRDHEQGNPKNPNGSRCGRLCASDWTKIPTKKIERFMFAARSWERDLWTATNSNFKE